jgi:hypothetical protein
MPDVLVRRDGAHRDTSQLSRPHDRAVGIPARPGLGDPDSFAASAQDQWCAASVPLLVALVRAGAGFITGRLIERSGEEDSGRSRLKDLDPQVFR